MWRFRYSLTSEARALTKFLKCVDWGDAQEARQAADLMQAWAPIAIADALELLSPDFSNEQVSLPLAAALCSSVCLLVPFERCKGDAQGIVRFRYAGEGACSGGAAAHRG